MGLIKRDQLQDTGEVLIEKPNETVTHRPAPRLVIAADDLPRAQNEAERIIEQAQHEAAALGQEAKEAGRREGLEEAAARVDEALSTLNQAVKERKRIIKDAEGELLRLSLKIAEQIIRSEVSLHRDVSLNIVSEAISRVSDREQIIVRVNRDDAEYLKRYKDRLAGMMDGVKSFSIIEDANIEPGGCVIETNLGFIDARIATKLRSIEEALQKDYSEENR
ncbi:MAG: FliH/SctL family protein [Candidatus Margulisbacteria bacterium]|jgi:flagellar assembly protein FliH|nr:FliH/SctL family protein [Candidatus Margulisiibacteriota bacterium]